MRTPVSLAAAAAFIAVVAVVAAQQQPPPVFRGRTDLVQLDVSVLDKQRKPVRGLTAEHFEVREDGKLQPLAIVSEIALPDEYATPPVWAKAAPADVSSNDVGEKRLFAIVIGRGDVSSPEPPRIMAPMPPNVLARRRDPNLVEAVREIAHGVVDRLGPADMAAILGTPCPQAFTDDKEKLNAAIDALLPDPPPCRPTLLGRRQPGPANRYQPLLIRDLAEYLAIVPQRRKAVIYIGPRLPAPAGGGIRSAQEWDYMQTLWLAQQANVNFYPISPYALGSGVRLSQFDSLKTLADETGGVAIVDPAKFEQGLDQLFVENGSYYMLGYRTTHPEMDGKFRRLSVKVIGRKDVMVRTRSLGYRPKVDAKAAATPASAPRPSTEIAPRLDGLLPNLDVTFDVAAMPVARPGTMSPTLVIMTEITEPVVLGTTRVVQKMDLRILAYSERGDLRRDVTERAVIDQAPSGEDGLRYAVVSRLDLEPGWYGLRVVAHNAGTDKVGSNEFEVHVPNFAHDAVSISGVALAMPDRSPLTLFGKPDPAVPVVPTSSRRFVTSDRVVAFARVYQGPSEDIVPVTLTVQLLDAAGHAVIDTKETLGLDRFNGDRSADYRLNLPMDRLRAGAYLLTIDAALGARHAPRRDVRFVIR